MSNLTINTQCPKCGQHIEAEFVGKYRDLLDKILERAGHQPGDFTYSEIMKKIGSPDDD